MIAPIFLHLIIFKMKKENNIGFTIGMLGYTRQLAENELATANKQDAKAIQEFLDKLDLIFTYLQEIRQENGIHSFDFNELILLPIGVRKYAKKTKSKTKEVRFIYRIEKTEENGEHLGYEHFYDKKEANKYCKKLKAEFNICVEIDVIDLKEHNYDIVSIMNQFARHPNNG